MTVARGLYISGAEAVHSFFNSDLQNLSSYQNERRWHIPHTTFLPAIRLLKGASVDGLSVDKVILVLEGIQEIETLGVRTAVAL